MKKIFKVLSITLITTACLILVLYLSAFLAGKPEIGKNYALELYDQQNDLFYASVNEQSGEWVDIDDVSQDFLYAIVDIEDKYFYYHPGFDPIGILRATFTNLKNGNLSQGASTITMQYVKNLFLTNEKTWERKIREAWLTMQVETHYQKEEILEGYINTVYFGAGIYGIQNASQYFFSKDAKDLNIQEASLLAGIVNGPELYSPTRNPKLVKERQALVLNAMAQNGHLSQTELDHLLLLETPLKLNQKKIQNQTLGYFKDQVLAELDYLGFDEKDCLKDGLKVYTTLDTEMQMAISQAMDETLKDNDELQSAMVIIEPNSGALRALAGGKDYQVSQYNRATMAQRQMASTVKPVLYYEALANGFTPISKFMSEKTTFRLKNDQVYAPTNYNDEYPNKEITMLDAIGTSDNIYAVKTHLFLGEETLAARLQSFGYQDAKAIPALALGCVETSPLALARMYNCFASLGTYYEDYCIERIENQHGQVIYKHQIESRKLLNEDLCLVLNQTLTAPFDEKLMDVTLPTMIQFKSDIPYAAKTGTSDWDNWTVVFNPQIVMCVWIGYDDGRPLENNNRFLGREIFQTVSQATQKAENNPWYQPNENIVQLPIDPLTGEFASDGTIYWFYQPTKPKYESQEVIKKSP